MLLTDAREAIVDFFKTHLTGLNSCETHGGRITEAELKRWSAKAPALRITCAATEQPFFQDGVCLPVLFGAYVITKNTTQYDRDEVALNLVQAVNALLPMQQWQCDAFASEPEKISSTNLFSSELDKSGINMWVVTWWQTVNIGDVQNLAELNDFLRFAGSSDNADNQPLIETQGNLEETP